MRPSFLPRLVNDPFGDPCLFVPFLFENHALLMDLGDIGALSSKDILKISHVFVSHTHMDHFVGFDRLLRVLLGRDKHLVIFGPKGFLENIQGKFSGYAWNLVQNYENPFTIEAFEIHSDKIRSRMYSCRKQFVPDRDTANRPFDKAIVHQPGFKVKFEILNHGIPCLAFILEENFHINIKKDALLEMGLPIGPWLNTFKQALYEHPADDDLISVPSGASSDVKNVFSTKELAEKIALVTPGQKVAYVTDAGYTEENRQKIIDAVKGADQLYIEAAFLEEHKEIAAAKHHLTARQAGEIAALAQVKQFTIFHFSPRYQGMEDALYREAKEAYAKAMK